MNEITNRAELIAATDYFRDTLDMLPSEKYSLARHIVEKCHEMGVSPDTGIVKLASAEPNDTKIIIKELQDREKYIEDINSLKKLVKVIEKIESPTNKIAAIEAFDFEYNLDRLWGKLIDNPIDIVLTVRNETPKVIKLASNTIKMSDITNKKDYLKKYFKGDFVEKLASNPDETITNLPIKIQELLFELVNE